MLLLKLAREGLGRAFIFINYITQPKSLARTVKAQQQVDQQTQTLSIYQFYACPFCLRVRRTVKALNLKMTYRDAQHDQQDRETLLNEGGKIQVPCLRIEKDQQIIWLYESNQINDYLKQQFG